MSFLAEQRRAQQLCIVAVSLCLDRPRTIQDIETFFVEHNERVEVTELYDTLMYAIGNGWLTMEPDPGRPTRYIVTPAGREAAKTQLGGWTPRAKHSGTLAVGGGDEGKGGGPALIGGEYQRI